jgi:hypothetical protein
MIPTKIIHRKKIPNEVQQKTILLKLQIRHLTKLRLENGNNFSYLKILICKNLASNISIHDQEYYLVFIVDHISKIFKIHSKNEEKNEYFYEYLELSLYVFQLELLLYGEFFSNEHLQ